MSMCIGFPVRSTIYLHNTITLIDVGASAARCLRPASRLTTVSAICLAPVSLLKIVAGEMPSSWPASPDLEKLRRTTTWSYLGGNDSRTRRFLYFRNRANRFPRRGLMLMQHSFPEAQLTACLCTMTPVKRACGHKATFLSCWIRRRVCAGHMSLRLLLSGCLLPCVCIPCITMRG